MLSHDWRTKTSRTVCSENYIRLEPHDVPLISWNPWPWSCRTAIFGGHISGRRLHGVKVNPLYKEQEGGEAEEEGEGSSSQGETVVRWYDSFPRTTSPAPAVPRNASSDTDLHDLFRTVSGLARDLDREPSRRSFSHHGTGKGKGKGKRSKPQQFHVTGVSGDVAGAHTSYAHTNSDVNQDVSETSDSVPGPSGVNFLAGTSWMSSGSQGFAMRADQSSSSTTTQACVEPVPRSLQQALPDTIPEESQSPPSRSLSPEPPCVNTATAHDASSERVHSDPVESSFSAGSQCDNCENDKPRIATGNLESEPQSNESGVTETEHDNESCVNSADSAAAESSDHSNERQNHDALSQSDQEVVSCDEQKSCTYSSSDDLKSGTNQNAQSTDLHNKKDTVVGDQTEDHGEPEDSFDAKTEGEGRMSPLSLPPHDYESSEHTIVYTSDEECPGSLMDAPRHPGHWASDSDWLDHESVARATEDAVSSSSASCSGLSHDVTSLCSADSRRPRMEIWSSDLSASLHTLPARPVKPILLSSSSEDGSVISRRKRCPSSPQDHKTVTFAEGTLFNEDKPRRYQKERINLRELYKARVGNDLSVARINPLFVDDEDATMEEEEEEDDNTSFCLTDDEKAARGSLRRSPYDSVSSIGSASLLSYQTTDLNTPVYMQRYLQQLQDSTANISREATLSQISLNQDPSGSRGLTGHESTEALYELPPVDHLVGQTPAPPGKRHFKHLVRWGALTLLVLSVAAIIIGIGVYFGRQPSPG